MSVAYGDLFDVTERPVFKSGKFLSIFVLNVGNFFIDI